MSATAGEPAVSPANEEAIEAWDGPLFERFVKYRHIVVAGLKQFGDEALRPGGQLVMVVWRAKDENEWVYRAQVVTERFVSKPDDYDEPTCGPGPFSMANADTTSGILLAAGFEDVTLRRLDLPFPSGTDLDEAVALVMDLGPAGEILRLQGERAAHLHEPIREALKDEMAPFAGPDGVVTAASTWVVTARAPG